MNSNSKKAILGMFVAIVMSLGVMGGINSTSNNLNLQQVGIGCKWIAGETKVGPGATNAWNAAGDICITVCSGMAINGAYHSYASTTNPVGWGYWTLTAVIGL